MFQCARKVAEFSTRLHAKQSAPRKTHTHTHTHTHTPYLCPLTLFHLCEPTPPRCGDSMRQRRLRHPHYKHTRQSLLVFKKHVLFSVCPTPIHPHTHTHTNTNTHTHKHTQSHYSCRDRTCVSNKLSSKFHANFLTCKMYKVWGLFGSGGLKCINTLPACEEKKSCKQ